MTDHQKESFRTHSNYIQAFRFLVYRHNSFVGDSFYSALNQRLGQTPLLSAPRTVPVTRDADIRKSLHAAWGTEALLHVSKGIFKEDDLLRLSNNWSAIQTYYIFYHCTQALQIAQAQPRPTNHPSTQNIFHSQWANREIQLLPWSLSYSCTGPVNVPTGSPVDLDIHPWSSCDRGDELSLAIKSLMTTRRNSLHQRLAENRERKRTDARKQWRVRQESRIAAGKRKSKERHFPLPHLSALEKREIDRKLRPFTVMDYLYRLRLKTNYEDSNMFLDGPEYQDESLAVLLAFCEMARGTLLIYEISIRNIVGAARFDAWVKSWLERDLPKDCDLCLLARTRHHTLI